MNTKESSIRANASESHVEEGKSVGLSKSPPAFSLEASPAQPPSGGAVQLKASVMQLAVNDTPDLAKVRKALEDDKENESISLIGTLSLDEVATMLRSADFQALAVDSYNNSEMYRAMKAAGVAAGGAFLKIRLKWMFAEGTNWSSLEDVVRNSTNQSELYGDDILRNAFVSELNNNEMAALVDLLGGTLQQKLLWMKAEGSDWNAVRAKIDAEKDMAKRALCYGVPELTSLFTSVCNNAEMVELVNMLGGTLLQKLTFMKAEGTNWDALRKMVSETTDLAQRTILYNSAEMLKLFVSECNNVQMADVVDLLGGTLVQKFTWMKEEGSSWGLVQAKIAATVDVNQKLALYNTPGMVDFFMDVCGNSTMRDAVKLIGGILKEKLKWMVAEGTNIDLVADVIRNSPADELGGVSAEPALMEGLKSALTGSGFATLGRMLNGELWQGEVVGVTDINSKHESMMTHSRSDIQISKKINFIEEGTFAPGGFAAMKAKAFNSIATYLDNKFKVKIEPLPGGSASPGDGTYPLRVSASSASSGTDIDLTGGKHGRSNAGNFYELGQDSEVILPDVVFGHEMAHVILGAPDEYAEDTHPTRNVFTDHSLMGDFPKEGNAGAQIKDRHYTYLIKYIQRYYPGRQITIVP